MQSKFFNFTIGKIHTKTHQNTHQIHKQKPNTKPRTKENNQQHNTQTDAIAEIAFGADLGTLHAEQTPEFVRHFDNVQKATALRFLYALFCFVFLCCLMFCSFVLVFVCVHLCCVVMRFLGDGVSFSVNKTKSILRKELRCLFVLGVCCCLCAHVWKYTGYRPIRTRYH